MKGSCWGEFNFEHSTFHKASDNTCLSIWGRKETMSGWEEEDKPAEDTSNTRKTKNGPCEWPKYPGFEQREVDPAANSDFSH